jgi:hypothetical protein
MEWQPIGGYEGVYEVSTNGEVRRLSDGAVLKQWKNDQGYMLVRLSGPRCVFRVHRLVASAFIPNNDGLPLVNHVDFNRANNKAENLEWCDQRYNLFHSQKMGRMQRDYWSGKRSPNAYLTDEIAFKIREEYESGGVSWEALGRKYDVSKRTVGRIIRRESYV